MKRLRVNYKVNAKGVLQPDITAEATDEKGEDVVVESMKLLKRATAEIKLFAGDQGFKMEVPA